jgi:NAD(P)H-quinone oxidoreductase subunit 5
LIIAIVLIYLEFGTLDFAALFASVKTLDETTTGLTVACFLLVIGAITKSAQFPLHTWLPLTMETPTPVSALMHAGIVNAGGYLVIRTSPLLAETPAALTTLAVIGGVTACFGAVVMITQSGVKNALAYSTIAQMGFMMLQCGLGAFSAAMLHIVAHSLYKAYAFLSSGSVITEATSIPRSTQASSPLGILSLVPMAALSILILMGSMLLFGLNPLTKPGGLLLGGVFCCALTFWLANALQAGNRRLVLPAIGIVVALCVVYSATYAATDAIVSGNLPKDAQPNFSIAVTSLFIVAFIGLFAIQWLSFSNSSTAKAWYVHASNGFYVDALCRRLATELSAFVYGRVRPRSPQEHV